MGADGQVEFPVEVVFAASCVGNIAGCPRLDIGGLRLRRGHGSRNDPVVSVTVADNLWWGPECALGAFRPIPFSASAYTVAYDITRNSSFIVTGDGVVREVNHTRGPTTDLSPYPVRRKSSGWP